MAATLGIAAIVAVAMPTEMVSAAQRWRRLLPLSIVLPLLGCFLLAAVNGFVLWTSLVGIHDAVGRNERAWMAVDTVHEMQGTLAEVDQALLGQVLAGERELARTLERAKRRLAALLARMEDLQQRGTGLPLPVEELREAVTRHLGQVGQRAGIPPLNAGGRLSLAPADFRSLVTIEAALRDDAKALSNHILARCRSAAALAAAGGLLSVALLSVMGVQGVRNVQHRRVAEAKMQAAHDTLEAKVAIRTAQLSHLSRHLLQLAETEKTTLANELHDELGSNLTAINLDISSVAARLGERDPVLAERLRRTLKLLHDTVDIKRRIIQGLRPSMLESLGLSTAINMHCEDFQRRTGLPCVIDCPEDFPEVDPACAIALYRVAQEALNNVSKYAQASRVHITLEPSADGVFLRVVDDGVGIEPDATDKPFSHGLLGMRERMAQLDGRFEVRRGDHGRGTVLEAFVPHRGA